MGKTSTSELVALNIYRYIFAFIHYAKSVAFHTMTLDFLKQNESISARVWWFDSVKEKVGGSCLTGIQTHQLLSIHDLHKRRHFVRALLVSWPLGIFHGTTERDHMLVVEHGAQKTSDLTPDIPVQNA